MRERCTRIFEESHVPRQGEREGCYFVGSAERERGFRRICELRKALAKGGAGLWQEEQEVTTKGLSVDYRIVRSEGSGRMLF